MRLARLGEWTKLNTLLYDEILKNFMLDKRTDGIECEEMKKNWKH